MLCVYFNLDAAGVRVSMAMDGEGGIKGEPGLVDEKTRLKK